MACDLCDGTLQLPDPNPEHSWHNGLPIGPCPACLIYPATDDVREVARTTWTG